MIGDAIRTGLARAGRLWGLVLMLLLVNLFAAALLAVPLAGALEDDLANRGAADRMLYGFDFPWWAAWADAHPGTTFSPEILGTGFAFKNIDLLLRGQLPAGLFLSRERDRLGVRLAAGFDPTVSALGALYLLVQVFLAGGVLGALRAPRPEWTVRGVLHGAGFYFGRLFRLAVLVLLVDALLFALYGPLARWADDQAREAVSERTAMAWLLGRHAALLLALLAVNMVSSYARVLVVLEERSSALLALLSAAALCVGNFVRTFGHVLAMALLQVAVLAAWAVLDRHWETVGYKSQLVTFVLLEGLVFARLFLRVAVLGGQVTLARRLGGGLAEAP